MDEMQEVLTNAIKNMDIQLARMLIVDNNMKPEGVREKDILPFARNAALLKDKPLLEQLFKYDKSLSGRLLWDVLDNIEIATMLVLSGADLAVQRDESSRPAFLHILAASNDSSKLKLAELMIDNGADVIVRDANGRSVLEYAIRAGARKDFIRKIIWNSVDYFSENVVVITDSDRSRELMPLVIGRVEDGPENAAMKSKWASNAIFRLIVWPPKEQSQARLLMIVSLLKHTLPTDILDSRGYEVIDRMMQTANFDVARLFYERGADPNRECHGFLPLFYALMAKDSSMATLMIRCGADILHRSSVIGARPIHGAGFGNSISNMLLLIRLGVDINVTDHRNHTPFTLLLKRDNSSTKVLRMFLIRYLALLTYGGSEINARDVDDIKSSPAMQELFDSCLKELQQMQKMQTDKGIPYYTFLIGKVDKTSRFTRRDDFTNVFENQTRLRELFPYYFCDLRNAFVFARKRENLVIANEKYLGDILYETCQLSLPDLIVNKIANYICVDGLKNFILEYHLCTFFEMIWD